MKYAQLISVKALWVNTEGTVRARRDYNYVEALMKCKI